MILFLNGGYTSVCDSKLCFEQIQEYAEKEEIISVEIEEDMNWTNIYRYLEDARAIVLVADVHMDSVPARVLRFMERVEQAVIDGESIGGMFYAVLYTELYEAEQTSVAMGILKNFCRHANITWGRGVGIGGNGMKATADRRNLMSRFKKNIVDFRLQPLQEQAVFIREKMQGTDAYINPRQVSKEGYIRRMNQKNKKSNRVKIAQN